MTRQMCVRLQHWVPAITHCSDNQPRCQDGQIAILCIVPLDVWVCGLCAHAKRAEFVAKGAHAAMLQVVLQVIENQVLVWLGSALAPLLPVRQPCIHSFLSTALSDWQSGGARPATP